MSFLDDLIVRCNNPVLRPIQVVLASHLYREYEKQLNNKDFTYFNDAGLEFLTLDGEKYMIYRGEKTLLFKKNGLQVKEYGGPEKRSWHMKAMALNGEDFLKIKVQDVHSEVDLLIAKDGSKVYGGKHNQIRGKIAVEGTEFLKAQHKRDDVREVYYSRDGKRYLDIELYNIPVKNTLRGLGLDEDYKRLLGWIDDKVGNNPNHDFIGIGYEKRRILYFKVNEAIGKIIKRNPDAKAQKEELSLFFTQLTSYVDRNPEKFMKEMGCLR